MADKSVNVNINYVVRTQGVQQAEAQVNRAEAATNRLNAATQNFSKQSSAGYKFAARSVEGMEVELARLKQQLKLTSVADTQRLSKLKADYSSAKKQLDDFNKSLFEQSRATRTASTSTNELSQNFGQLFTAVKLILTAGIVRQVADMSIEMSRLAGNVEGVDRAFTRAFPNGDLLLSGLRRSTRGTVKDFELMQRTLQATNLGVSVEHLGVLFEFAATRAQQTGENVDYLVDSIVRGIGRKSVLVLDNLGLSTTRLKEEFGGAAIASQSVADVTKGVANIARVELEKMGGYVETAATKVDQLAVSWQRAREEAAKFFSDGRVVEFLKDYSDSFGDLLEAQRRGITVSELFSEQLIKREALFTAELFIQRNLTGEREKDVKIIEQEIRRITHELGIKGRALETTRQLIDQKKAEHAAGEISLKAFIEDNKAREKTVDLIVEDINIRQEWLRLFQAQLAAIKQGNKGELTEQLGIIEKLEEEIKGLNEAIRKATTTEIGQNLSAQLDIAQRALERFKASISQEPPTVDLTKVSQGVQNVTANIKQGFTEVNEFSRNITDVFKEGTDAAGDLTTKVLELISALENVKPIPPPIPPDFLDQLQAAVEESKEILIGTGIDIFAQQITDLAQVQVAELQVQLDNLRTFYDDQERLAGDNQAAKKQLREQERQETRRIQREIAEQQKQANRFSIIVDTAAGIIKAFATLPPPAAIVQAAIVAALGASQLAIVNRTPLPRFAKGVIGLDGPGNGTSDSIIARVSKGESIITSEDTRNSKKLLGDIKARRINDRVMKDLQVSNTGVKYVGMDPKPIVDAINTKKETDFERVGSVLYRVIDNGKGYKKRIRSKIMGL